MLRLDKHIAVSPTTIRKIRDKMSELLIEYKKQQEKNHSPKELLKVVGGVDETFFEKMILIFMDLSSGYIFFEEESQDRSYNTWMEKVHSIVNKFGIKIEYIVSDRAKALIKLAVKGLECLSIPDLFHASYEIVKLFGLNLNRKKDNLRCKLAKAITELSLLKELSKDIREKEKMICNLKNEYAFIESGISRYQSLLHQLSLTIHPFDVNSSNKQTSTIVLDLLIEIVVQIKTLQKEYDLNDNKKRIPKFNKQIEGIASLIDAWWLWCEETLHDDKIDNDLKDWLLMYLLPTAYWQYQVNKTKNPDLKESYRTALKNAQTKLEQHPLTPLFIQAREGVRSTLLTEIRDVIFSFQQ